LKSASSRRDFLKTTAAVTAGIVAAPNIATASRTNSQIIVGEKDLQFEVIHHFPQLPSQYSWQTTHNVAVDAANNLYVIHEGHESKKDHPSIFVFDEKGKFIRAFGKQYQGGGHGIEVRKEGNQEFVPWDAQYFKYKTMVTAMDASIGIVLDTIRELGIENHTLIVFTSDNGAEMGAGTGGVYKQG
jgi:arylsulfatase A-like enzyme